MAQPLTDSINALTRYANSVTGASDTTLSEAVATLAAGYRPPAAWDYEWYATSGTTPPGAAYSGSPTFTDDYMTVTNLNLPISNFTGGFEIKAVINHNGNATSNSPQICLKNSLTKYGAKIYPDASKQLIVAGMTASESITVDDGFHEYDIKCENGIFTAFYDGVQFATGGGRYNSNYDSTLVAGAASFSYKYICYREL